MSLYRIALLLVSVSLALGCTTSEASPDTRDSTHARAAKDSQDASPRLPLAREVVVAHDLSIRHLLSGSLATERAVELVAPDTGIHPLQIRWLAENGSEVKPGESLVEFDNSQLVSNLEQREEAVEQAIIDVVGAESEAAAQEAQAYFELQQKRAELAKATIDAEVPEELKAARDYEKLQLEKRRAQLHTVDAERNLEAKQKAGRSDVEVKLLALKKARQEIQRAKTGIEVLTLRASRAGVFIIERNHDQGRPWQEGDSIYPGGRIARLPDFSTMIVRARLFDVDDGAVAPGVDATVSLDAFPDLSFPGRVRQIDRVALQSGPFSLSRTFGLIVDLATVDPERMRPGMSAKVEIEQRFRAAGSEGFLLAPRECLAQDPEVGSQALLAARGWVPVVVGPCSAHQCVIEEGLTAGELLGWASDLETEP